MAAVNLSNSSIPSSLMNKIQVSKCKQFLNPANSISIAKTRYPVSFSPISTQLHPKSQQTRDLSSSGPPSTRFSRAVVGSSSLDPSDAVAALKPQSLKFRLRNGETLYGLFLCSFSPVLAEIVGFSGYDFVVVDMEHGHGGISDALSCLRALAATRTAAILRLPESSATWAKKALDLGPQGLMFPMISTAEAAKKAVSYCRYPPKGVRGAAHSIVRASGYGIDEGYLEKCEDELLIMCQVEEAGAVGKVKEIAAVEGVDCIQMGPLDLSASMGCLWDPGNKKVKEKLREAEEGVLKSKSKSKLSKSGGGGAYLAGFAMPFDSPEQMKSRGYHMVSGAVDIGLFRSAAVEDVRKFKASLEKKDDPYDDEGKEKGYYSE